MKRLTFLVVILLCASPASALEVVRQRNQATVICFPISYTNTSGFVSGAAGLDSEYTYWDDGAGPGDFQDLTNEAYEIGSSGWHCVTITQDEINHEYIAIEVNTSTPNADSPVPVLIRTQVADPQYAASTSSGYSFTVDGEGGNVYADMREVEGADASDTIIGADGDTLESLSDQMDGMMPNTEDGSSFTSIPWNAAWDAEVESEVDDSIGGGTGTALTAIPWNAAWDAEVESEVDDSIGGGTGTALTAIPWNAAWSAESIGIDLDNVSGTLDAAEIGVGAIGASELGSDAVDEIHDEIMTGTLSHRDCQILQTSALVGETAAAAAGANTEVTFETAGAETVAITATVDASGQRLTVTTDPS